MVSKPELLLNAGETQWKRPMMPHVGFSAGAPPPQPEFINAASFQGYRQGYVFKTGSQGLGYYLDAEDGQETEPMTQMGAPMGSNSNPGGQARGEDRMSNAQARRRPNRPNRSREDEIDPMVSNTIIITVK